MIKARIPKGIQYSIAGIKRVTSHNKTVIVLGMDETSIRWQGADGYWCECSRLDITLKKDEK